MKSTIERGDKYRMKKKLPIFLAVWPYMFFGVYLIKNGKVFNLFIVVYSILTIAMYILNIIYACRLNGAGSHNQLAFWDMFLKLVHLPFYLLTLLIGAFIFISIETPSEIYVGSIFVFCLILADLFLMSISSIYGINALLRARKKKAISTAFMILHSILHCIIVSDVISAVILFLKLRKQI